MADQKQISSIDINGGEALAWGAVEGGVQFVTGHPGSPGTAVVDELLRMKLAHIRLEWGINERSAFDAAFGASLAGVRSLVCFKSVGLNVALDSLMVSNLSGGDAGFVILTGDDPGGWGSQNEEDSRPLIAAAEIPMLEPSTPADGRRVMRLAFELAERIKTPVAVRATYAMSKDQETVHTPLLIPARLPAVNFQRQEDRWTVTPNVVVSYHQRLVDIIKTVCNEFEHSELNQAEGRGKLGIAAPGYAYQKLKEVLGKAVDLPVRILRLGTLYPLPENTIAEFLRGLDAVLVIEEIVPYLENQLPAIAQRAGLLLPIYGRRTGHVPDAGELFPEHIAQAVSRFLPGWQGVALPAPNRSMISQDPLCEGCPYIPGFGVLLEMMAAHGGRDAFIVTGESGCMIRAQVTPQRILDTKFAMGSSIGIAAGIARSGVPQKIVALTGDTAFLHTGINELIDAVQAGVDLLIVLLDNGTAAISGGQPHAAVPRDLSGKRRIPVDLAALIHAAGVENVRIVDPVDLSATRQAYEAALSDPGISAVIIRRPCPYFASEQIIGSSS
jgi:indolepyruvate ferredoxin oxidoreductase alpha subunit